ncbi:hypothetical protein RG959_23450 [Domibacillus sp. 8LH]|uniref:hypothetical protein n=1 Tax=Domibacillus sp. 8LH TaxID=3073900 RepID=UPI00317D5049
MTIDEKATIGSILEAIRNGIPAVDIAKNIKNISQKPLLAALKNAGYEYSNRAPKGWNYVGEGPEPLDKSIFEFRAYDDSSSKKSSSQADHKQFTQDEIHIIREMLKDWQEKKEEKTPQGVGQPLHERIKDLPNNGKTRKTIVIDNKIGELLDEFCKVEKVNKSDVLHLALADFLNKYQK